MRRNERLANEYLDGLRRQLTGSGIVARSMVLRGDARAQLVRLAAEERVDLTILSACGKGARADRTLGSVAAHLAAHTDTPLLLMRAPVAASRARHIA